MSTQDLDTVPWYRQFWPWFIMVPPAAAIAASLVTIWVAFSNAPDLSVADYTDIENIAATEKARRQAAAELRVTARLTFSEENAVARRVNVTLTGSVRPEALQLYLRHRTQEEKDRSTLLPATGDGTYAGLVERLSGTYDIEILPPDNAWSVGSELLPFEDAVTAGAGDG